MTPAEALFHIQCRLAVTTPMNVIDEMMPLSGGKRWVQRLSHWEEFRGQFSDQAIAVARVVSHRAKREGGFSVTSDGRVIEGSPKPPAISPAVSDAFTLTINGKPVKVEYIREYFPGRDHIEFRGEEAQPQEVGDEEAPEGSFYESVEGEAKARHYFYPPNPGAISDTGFHGQFIPHDAIEAMGGPQEFASRYAEALVARQGDEFLGSFEGKRHEVKKARKKVGKHTAAVVEVAAEKPEQGRLF